MRNSPATHKKRCAPLEDSFGRRIDYLRVSVTDRCNLKCVYCVPKAGVTHIQESGILSSEEIARFVSIVKRFGLRKVRLTGGEPLVRPDILRLVSLIKATGIRDLSLTTNGIRLADMAEDLKKAGINRVNISLDTLDPEKYRAITRGGDIHSVLEGIRKSEEAGLYPVKINVVPMPGLTDNEIQKFASLTFEKDYHIRYIEFMRMGRNEANGKTGYMTKREIMDRVSELGRLIPLTFRGGGPSRNYRLEGARGVVGFISPVTDHFCRSCNRLRLTAAGMLRPCLFSNVELDVRALLRSGTSDEELNTLFQRAVAVKPAGHSLEREKTFVGLSSMSEIGG
ncbi:MAG: GTP 3',8-cyclase MoaA [Deltaproteobacteria bacterium]|nr:GTP 3',8-cyclase MoaA [Deltaproteobacteria bacterium]